VSDTSYTPEDTGRSVTGPERIRLRTVYGDPGKRRAARLAVLTAALLAVVGSANACFVCIVPYQSLLDRIEASQQTIVARPVDKQQTKWQVVRVITGKRIDVGQTITAESGMMVSGDLQLLRRATSEDPWIIEVSAEQELVAFLARAVELSSHLTKKQTVRQQSQYLRFFVPLLEHPHPKIADSAYNKIARAPYEAIRRIETEIRPEQLLAWIEDPQIAQARKSLYITLLGVCGGDREAAIIRKWIDAGWQQQNTENLGALLTAHAQLNEEETIRFIEKSYIQNRDRKLGELIAAVNALRVHGQADGKVSRSRIVTSFQLLLRERPALTEMVVEDCARWEDWSVAPKLMELYAGGKQPWNNAMIIKYLEACPLPSAKLFVQRVATPTTK
jgi:hypothetical protein